MPRTELNRKAPVVGTAEADIEAPVLFIFAISAALLGVLLLRRKEQFHG